MRSASKGSLAKRLEHRAVRPVLLVAVAIMAGCSGTNGAALEAAPNDASVSADGDARKLSGDDSSDAGVQPKVDVDSADGGNAGGDGSPLPSEMVSGDDATDALAVGISNDADVVDDQPPQEEPPAAEGGDGADDGPEATVSDSGDDSPDATDAPLDTGDALADAEPDSASDASDATSDGAPADASDAPLDSAPDTLPDASDGAVDAGDDGGFSTTFQIILSAQGAACAACAQSHCLTSGLTCESLGNTVAAQGPEAGTPRTSLCYSTLACVIRSTPAIPCYDQGALPYVCYCATKTVTQCKSGGPGVDSQCATQEQAGLETTDPTMAYNRLNSTDTTLGAQMANAIAVCLGGASCGNVCLP
jgi:hypothetical protein